MLHIKVGATSSTGRCRRKDNTNNDKNRGEKGKYQITLLKSLMITIHSLIVFRVFRVAFPISAVIKYLHFSFMLIRKDIFVQVRRLLLFTGQKGGDKYLGNNAIALRLRIIGIVVLFYVVK